jgi:hypothetical protein
VILGKTGSGKSSALRHMVEHLLEHKKRVCIVDPKGDWWGLKLGANGKDPGLPVIMFGDFKEPKALMSRSTRRAGSTSPSSSPAGIVPASSACAAGIQQHMHRFWIDFASTLFAKNVGELYFVGDEFHNFAPKGKILSPQAGESLHWSNRLLSEGRGLGMVCLFASQRPQKVHNDTLTSAETLIAMRVVHAADREAIKEWIDGNGDPVVGKEVLNTLAGLERGEAWAWSPEIGFGPERVKFPMFTTFDSFAPPQLQKKISTGGWAEVNLEEVKQKLSTVIEEHKANDPKELQKIIAELRRQLKAAPNAKPIEKIVEKPVVTDQQVKRVETVTDRIEAEGKRRLEAAEKLAESGRELLATARDFAAALGKARSPVDLPSRQPIQHVRRPVAATAARTPEKGQASGDGPDRAGRAILSVLANYPEGCDAGKLTLLTGYRYSGGFKNSLSDLRARGYITGGNTETMKITDEGLAQGPFVELPTGREFVDYWLNHRSLDKCAKAILKVLIEHPEGLTADEIREKTDPPYEYSGGFKNALSDLRTAGLIIGKNTSTMTASEELLAANEIT